VEQQETECVWCRQPLAADAEFCQYCDRAQRVEAGRTIDSDERYLIAETRSGQYGLWDLWTSGEPIFDSADLDRVFNIRDRLRDGSPTDSHSARHYGALFVIAAIVIVAYIAFHAFRYGSCIAQPGIFAWPSACV